MSNAAAAAAAKGGADPLLAQALAAFGDVRPRRGTTLWQPPELTPKWNEPNAVVWFGGSYRMAAYYHETARWVQELGAVTDAEAYGVVDASGRFGRRLDPFGMTLFFRNSPYWMAVHMLHGGTAASRVRVVRPVPDATEQFRFAQPHAAWLQRTANALRNADACTHDQALDAFTRAVRRYAHANAKWFRGAAVIHCRSARAGADLSPSQGGAASDFTAAPSAAGSAATSRAPGFYVTSDWSQAHNRVQQSLAARGAEDLCVVEYCIPAQALSGVKVLRFAPDAGGYRQWMELVRACRSGDAAAAAAVTRGFDAVEGPRALDPDVEWERALSPAHNAATGFARAIGAGHQLCVLSEAAADVFARHVQRAMHFPELIDRFYPSPFAARSHVFKR